MKTTFKRVVKATGRLIVSTTCDALAAPIIPVIGPALLPVAIMMDIKDAVTYATTNEEDTHEIKDVQYSVVAITEEEG